jgi:hypothetical protein
MRSSNYLPSCGSRLPPTPRPAPLPAVHGSASPRNANEDRRQTAFALPAKAIEIAVETGASTRRTRQLNQRVKKNVERRKTDRSLRYLRGRLFAGTTRQSKVRSGRSPTYRLARRTRPLNRIVVDGGMRRLRQDRPFHVRTRQSTWRATYFPRNRESRVGRKPAIQIATMPWRAPRWSNTSVRLKMLWDFSSHLFEQTCAQNGRNVRLGSKRIGRSGQAPGLWRRRRDRRRRRRTRRALPIG